MAYIPTLITSSLVQAKLVSLLCITSLIATAYILAFIPTTGSKSQDRVKSKRQLKPEAGPIHRYIGYLNGALSLVCALNSVTFREKAGVHDGFWVLCLLPVGRCSLPLQTTMQPDGPCSVVHSRYAGEAAHAFCGYRRIGGSQV